MPVFFFGHGSPLNAIEDTEFSRTWSEIGKEISKPKAILCISAHWETNGTLITAMDNPKTIHDFGGFPNALYEVQYPAAGNPELAEDIKKLITKTNIELDYKWGLDHGCWSILKHLFPDADIPVLQLSLDYSKPPQYHYDLGKEFASIRQKDVLIIGSGNVVHNLKKIDWKKQDNGHKWETTANSLIVKLISENKHQELVDYKKLGQDVELAVPTPEHYLPLLYMLALKQENETVSFFNNRIVMGSLSMMSMKIS